MVGGIAKLSFHLYNHLRRLGINVKVVAFGDNSSSHEDIIFFTPSSSITNRTDHSLSGALKIPIDIKRFTHFVNKLIKTESFDVVHVLEPYVGGFIRHKYKVTTIHDTVCRELKAWVKYPLQQSFKRIAFYSSLGYIMEFFSIHNSKVIITPSIGTASTLRRIYKVHKSNIRVIPNGIERPKKLVDQQIAKKSIGIDPNTILIFTTAHHVARKRLEVFIKAVKYLKNWNVKNFKAIISGEGPLTNYYREITCKLGVSNLIVFTGWLNEKELDLYYSACDIFVITSEAEAGPITLLEAGIRGKAIVTTNIDGLPILMKHGIHCLKFDIGDSKMLAKHLQKLIFNDKARMIIGSNAKIFSEQFTWDKIARKVAQVYQELMDESYFAYRNN